MSATSRRGSSDRASAGADQPPDNSQAPFFVRALHSFSPENLAGTSRNTSAQQQANSCISFTAGQIIKCLNRDPSGWWDGELDGRRGWFPSNYVEVLDLTTERAEPTFLSANAATLLGSIEHNVGLLEHAVKSQNKGNYQPSTACVISSIRTVLSATSALTRDSPVLRQHPTLASSRKRILSSLASLVNQARKASAPAPPNPPAGQDQRDAEDAQEMLHIARETLASVKTFLADAEDKGVDVDLWLAHSTPAPGSIANHRGDDNDPVHSVRTTKSTSSLHSQRRPTITDLHDPVPSTIFPVRPPKSEARAAVATSSDTADSSHTSKLILRSPSALSLHLSTLHDSLLSTVAALIGHVHSHARSSSPASSFAHLIDLTREAIERVHDVLVVVEKVAAAHGVVLSSPNPDKKGMAGSDEVMQELVSTREKLYETTTALVAAARLATSPREGTVAASRKSSTDSNASADASRERKRLEREQDEEERQALLSAATGVLRAGGACVGAVKRIVPELAAKASASGMPFELTLPRPKTVEELASEEHVHGGDPSDTSLMAGPAAADNSSSADGSAAFADADEDAPVSVSAEAERRAISRPVANRESPRKGHAHTLSMLGRKATSLTYLRGRYETDGNVRQGVGALSIDEAQEHPEGGAIQRETDGDSAGSFDSQHTASSPVLPRPSSAASVASAVRDDPSRLATKPPPSSLVPSGPTSTRPGTPSQPQPAVSPTMHRGKSCESAHSASSSRVTATSLASSSAVTSGTAETSPRSSVQSPPSLAAALLKGAPRSSHDIVHGSGQAATGSTSPSPNATPRGSVSSGSSPSGSPWFLQRDYAAHEISFNADGHVSGGTLRCLVERMTLHDTTIDAAFSNTFLLCFRMFTTPLELAGLLWARFDFAQPRHPETGEELSSDEVKKWTAQKLTPIRLRIFNLFKTWLESYWLHDPDREIVEGLLEWCDGRLKAAMPSASTRLADLVRKRIAAAQRDEAVAGRDNGDGFVYGQGNGSSTSLASRSASPSMNGSSLSLTVSNTPSVPSTRSGLGTGGPLHKMQSMDRLKAGKAIVPFSSLAAGASPTSASSPVVDAYSPSSASAASASPPIVTKSLVANLRPALSGRMALLSSVTEIDPLELARQLTIMESRVYCSIRADELLGSGNGDTKHVSEAMKTPSVRKMSSLSTRLTGWITEAILGEQDQKRRTALLKYFIKLGERLLQLSNYNALFAVFTALNSSTISRLRKTWDGLAPKYRASFETLRKATDHGRNYADYRHRIRQAVPPCLPFVGLFLTDLIFVFEGNRAERPSPADPSLLLINFDRYHKMARIVGELQRFQSPYSLVEVPEMQAYLSQELEGLKRGQDAQSLYRQSLMIEPRQGSGPSSSAASIISSHDSHRTRDLFNWRS